MRARKPTALALLALLVLLGSVAPRSAEPAPATLTASARVVDASAGTAALRAAESLLNAAESRGEANAAGALVRITVIEGSRRDARVVEIAFVAN
jgi:hypothetical protein